MNENKLKEVIYEVVHEATKGRELSISNLFASFEKKLEIIISKLNEHELKIAKIEQTHCEENRMKNKGFTIVGWILGASLTIGTGLVGFLMTQDKEQKDTLHKIESRVGIVETDATNIKTNLTEIKTDIKQILKELK